MQPLRVEGWPRLVFEWVVLCVESQDRNVVKISKWQSLQAIFRSLELLQRRSTVFNKLCSAFLFAACID